MKPRALFDAAGRKKLAQLIVWGAGSGRSMTKHQIEKRLEKVLERIARKLAGEIELRKAA